MDTRNFPILAYNSAFHKLRNACALATETLWEEVREQLAMQAVDRGPLSSLASPSVTTSSTSDVVSSLDSSVHPWDVGQSTLQLMGLHKGGICSMMIYLDSPQHLH